MNIYEKAGVPVEWIMSKPLEHCCAPQSATARLVVPGCTDLELTPMYDLKSSHNLTTGTSNTNSFKLVHAHLHCNLHKGDVKTALLKDS